MKILALRGENLASLAAPFEIDFEAPPLRDAGVFAISGPTGAGKSTLLDALCLALYHRTPRLEEAAVATLTDAAGDAIQARDPRQWLRRGSAAGFAEVDFVGRDGQRWRARWSVKRARGRGDGRLQAAEATLLALGSGERRGRTISEVRDAIIDCIGLDFAQFTRAVLLAQNQFARFLAADANQRAELLEALTGAQLYSQLSRAAFERARQSRDALSVLERSLQAQAPLSGQALAELGAELADTERQEDALREQLRALQAGLDWHRQRLALEADAEAARHHLHTTQAELAAQADAALELRGWQLAAEARPLLEAQAQTSTRMLAAQAELQVAQTRHERAGADLDAAQHILAQRLDEEQQATSRWRDAQPLLARARMLDQQLAVVQHSHAGTVRDCSDQQARVDRIQAELDDQQALVQQHKQQLDRVLAWCQEHGMDAQLCTHWPRLQTLLAQLLALRAELVAAQAGRDALRARWQRSAAAVKAADHDHSQQRDGVLALRTALEQANATLTALDIAGLQSAQAALGRDQQALLRIGHAWTELQRCSDDLADAVRQDAILEAQRVTAAAAIDRLTAERASADVHAQTSQALWDAARTSADPHTRQLRAQLQAAHPCPVCGALEHPYQASPPPLDPALADVLDGLQRAALSAADQLHAIDSALQREQVTLAQLKQRQLAQQDQSQRQREREHQASRTLQQRWLDAGWPPLPEPAGAAVVQSLLQARGADLDARAIALELRQQAARSALADGDRLQRELGAATRHLEQVEQVLRDAQREHARIESSGQQRAHDCQRLEERLQQAQHELDHDPGWPAGVAAATVDAALQQALADRVEHWRVQAAERDALAQALGRSEQLLIRLREQLALEQPVLGQRRADCDTSQRTVQDLQAQRLAVSAELDTSAWQQRLQHRLDSAGEALAQAREAHTSARDQHAATAQAQVRGSQATLDAQHQHSAATQAVQTWLQLRLDQHPQLSREVLQDWLAVPQSTVQQRQQQLATLQQALQSADLAATQAQSRLHQWLGEAAVPPAPLAVLQLEHTAQQQALDAVLQRRGALREQHAADQRLRERQQALLEQIEQARLSQRTWGQLNDLIGSADGARFRRLAQQYTLDLVLAYSNVHLRELSPRYQLRRDGESLLVVDADLGEAIRAVSSLSGGETFLVSLALALGLASLTSQRLHIESLFIDEGFGALDEHSLRLALDALDRLQAQGRKIGVISHLPELTERVATRIDVRRVGHGASVVSVRG